ncbi:MAG: hypothetical protein DRO11_00020 [Methanobacteriota archaeon]|nr:MAG: hypothetical protein DRO11_00020 [Euryarchaeota archaeon]
MRKKKENWPPILQAISEPRISGFVHQWTRKGNKNPFQRICQALLEHPEGLTASEIEEITGISRNWVRTKLGEIRGAGYLKEIVDKGETKYTMDKEKFIGDFSIRPSPVGRIQRFFGVVTIPAGILVYIVGSIPIEDPLLKYLGATLFLLGETTLLWLLMS